MAKKSPSKQHMDPVHGSAKLARPPIHHENEENEEEEMETEENVKVKRRKDNKKLTERLYPDMNVEHEIEEIENISKAEDTVYQSYIESFKSNFIYIIVGIIFSVIVFCFMSTPQEDKPVLTVSRLIEDMGKHFKHQRPMTFRGLKSQLQKVVNVTHEPLAPAIITLVADKGAEIKASEFSLYLGKALAPKKYILINDSSYWNGNPDSIKWKIDEEIQSKYEKNQLNVIIVDKLQKIPFEAAMIFHSYCDHENSPIKRAVLLFIMPLNKIIPESANLKDLDIVAMNSLRNTWHTATEDEVDSLITRITVSVVNIK